MKTYKAMKQFVHDLEVELNLTMAVPVGGYGTIEETPLIKAPKVLALWMWRYVDEWLEDETEQNKEKYLVELIKSVRDEQIEEEPEEEPEEDPEEEPEEEEDKMCECQHCDCNNVAVDDNGLCEKCFEKGCDNPEGDDE